MYSIEPRDSVEDMAEWEAEAIEAVDDALKRARWDFNVETVTLTGKQTTAYSNRETDTVIFSYDELFYALCELYQNMWLTYVPFVNEEPVAESNPEEYVSYALSQYQEPLEQMRGWE